MTKVKTRKVNRPHHPVPLLRQVQLKAVTNIQVAPLNIKSIQDWLASKNQDSRGIFNTLTRTIISWYRRSNMIFLFNHEMTWTTWRVLTWCKWRKSIYSPKISAKKHQIEKHCFQHSRLWEPRQLVRIRDISRHLLQVVYMKNCNRQKQMEANYNLSGSAMSTPLQGPLRVKLHIIT